MYRHLVVALTLAICAAASRLAFATETSVVPEESMPIDIITMPVEDYAAAAQADQAQFVRLSNNGLLTIAPGATAVCTLYVKNIGTNNWNNTYLLRSVSSIGTTPVSSLLASNWRSGSTTNIAIPTSSLIYAENGSPNPANSAQLNWTAVGDDGMSGRASQYDVRYSTTAYSGANWQYGIPFDAGLEPSDSGTPETVRVTGLTSDRTYYFALRTADERPNWAAWSNVASITTATATARFVFQVRAPMAAGTFPLYLALYNGSGTNFTNLVGTIRLTVATTNVAGTSFTPLVGKFNNDQFTDIGLYQPEFGKWHVATNSIPGTSVVSYFPATNPWISDWAPASAGSFVPLVGDFNGDGKTDLCAYQPSTGDWYVRTSNGTTFVGGNLWLDNWAPASAGSFVPLVGDFNGDGKTDVTVYSPASGRWFVAASTGTVYQVSNGFATNGSWLDNWGRLTPTTPAAAQFVQEESPEPSLRFAFNPIAPNPSRGQALLTFTLPTSAAVDLTIYDLQGRTVERLVNGSQPAGQHRVDWHPRTLVPGMYFARLRSPFGDRVQRIVLVP